MSKKMYGKEWRCTGFLPHDEAIAYIRETIDRAGGVFVKATAVASVDENHWFIDCDDMDEHSHIYVKWWEGVEDE